MSERTRALLQQMSVEEKASLLAGTDMWHNGGVERLGVPPLKVTDGPNGARGESFRGGAPSACFPCGSALGATWNPELVERVGAAIGEEARLKGAQILLAPTVNIHRTPLAGRNFECYSEDPHLSGQLAAGFVRGCQGVGVGTTVKHLVCNDSEFERNTISSEVDERTLREIYLPPFEAAVRDAGSRGVMSAYNRLNGTYCSENARLLNEILREEWGFEGFVISDWFGTHSADASLEAGLDLEMPGPPRHRGQKLVDAVKSGGVSEAALDRSALRMLDVAEQAGLLDAKPSHEEQSVDDPRHRAIAREAAGEALVLLKNEGACLPLATDSLQRLAVIGPNASVALVQGGGSAGVNPHYAISVLDGLRELCGDGVEIEFSRGCTSHKRMPTVDERIARLPDGSGPGLSVQYFEGFELAGEPVLEKRAHDAELVWFGAPPEGLEGDEFSVCLRAEIRSEESGAHVFGLTSAGRSRLFIDDTLVVDNWQPEGRSDFLFGAGSAEVTGSAQLDAGRRHELRIEFSREGAAGVAGLRATHLPPMPEDMLERAVALAESADAAVVVVGLNSDWESEGHDRADMELPGRQVELLRKVAAANPRTAVVVNAGAPVAMEWAEDVPAIVQMGYLGQEAGRAAADVLLGTRNPSGRLPTTFPRRIEDTPAFDFYPGQDGKVEYGEGIFVGYRHYDTRGVEVRFPFGHGLSYTDFEYGEIELEEPRMRQGDPVRFALSLRNCGQRAGSEVVQVYLRDIDSRLPRPAQELKAFAKPRLEPGERTTLHFELAARDLSYFDPELGDWVAEAGDFELRIGSSSRDIRVRAVFELLD